MSDKFLSCIFGAFMPLSLQPQSSALLVICSIAGDITFVALMWTAAFHIDSTPEWTPNGRLLNLMRNDLTWRVVFMKPTPYQQRQSMERHHHETCAQPFSGSGWIK